MRQTLMPGAKSVKAKVQHLILTKAGSSDVQAIVAGHLVKDEKSPDLFGVLEVGSGAAIQMSRLEHHYAMMMVVMVGLGMMMGGNLEMIIPNVAKLMIMDISFIR